MPTIGEWLHILEMTGQIIVVPPYFENFGKRIIKSSKLYWGDRAWLAICSASHRRANWTARHFSARCLKASWLRRYSRARVNRGERKELYFFRDQQGLEVDFLIPRPNAGLWPVEAKASKTVRPAMAAPLLSLQRALGKRAKRLIVVHRKSEASFPTAALAPGVEALDVGQLVADLTRGR